MTFSPGDKVRVIRGNEGGNYPLPVGSIRTVRTVTSLYVVLEEDGNHWDANRFEKVEEEKVAETFAVGDKVKCIDIPTNLNQPFTTDGIYTVVGVHSNSLDLEGSGVDPARARTGGRGWFKTRFEKVGAEPEETLETFKKKVVDLILKYQAHFSHCDDIWDMWVTPTLGLTKPKPVKKLVLEFEAPGWDHVPSAQTFKAVLTSRDGWTATDFQNVTVREVTE